MADRLEERHPELEAAEFEAERPARELSGLPKLVVSAAAVAVSLNALYWVASPSEAVLDYYELEGRRLAEGGQRRLEPTVSPRLDRLPLVATELGRRTLVVDGRRLPLFQEGQGPARLVLSVRH